MISSIDFNSGEFQYLPVNIGIENDNINSLIMNHNDIVSERNDYLSSAGETSYYLQKFDNQLQNSLNNVFVSLSNFKKSLGLKIENLKKKEVEFKVDYNNLPQNEKILREIEREQEIKESLFLLLLQKREEAAINFAVTRPSIKIIDKAITSLRPVSPKTLYIISTRILYNYFFI